MRRSSEICCVASSTMPGDLATPFSGGGTVRVGERSPDEERGRDASGWVQ